MSTPVGFDGTMNEDGWAGLASSMTGFPYSASAAGDWTITKVSNADRTVRVTGSPASDGWGIGNAPATSSIQLDPTASTRWDLIVWLIDWSADSWTLQVVKGAEGSAVQPTVSDTATAGTTIARIPIGWVQVASGQQLPTKVQQCRVWRNPLLYAESLVPLQPYQRPGLTVDLVDGSRWRSDGTAFAQVRDTAPYWIGSSTSWTSGISINPGVWLIPIWGGSGTANLTSSGGALTLSAGVWSASVSLVATPNADSLRLIPYADPGSIPSTLAASEPSGTKISNIGGSSNLLTLTKSTRVAFTIYNAGSDAVKLWVGGNSLTLVQLAQI